MISSLSQFFSVSVSACLSVSLYACLSACISPRLWCDGVEHCPSGRDEAGCGPRLPLHLSAAALLYLVSAGAALVFLATLVVIGCRVRRCRRSRGGRHRGCDAGPADKRASNGTLESMVGPGPGLHNKEEVS